MEVGLSLRVSVTEETQVGEARRLATRVAEERGMGPVDVGRAALVATELAGNLVKHTSRGGELLLRPLHGEGGGVEVLALDAGAGIADVPQAMQDGFSTAGSAGTGIGAVSRLSDLFQLHSRMEQGTAILAQVWAQRRRPAAGELGVGAVCVPKRGEEVSGDAWVQVRRGRVLSLLVVDGLGHGEGAARAAAEAVRLFGSAVGGESPAELVSRAHEWLRPTRGAALAVAHIDPEAGVLRFAGVGNISGIVLEGEGSRSLVSHNGIVGHQLRRVQEFEYPWLPTSLLVTHTDGLLGRWSLDAYPGVRARHPALVAGVLYRDFQRGSDDVTVVVVGAVS